MKDYSKKVDCDDVDLKILKYLQVDGRIPNADLAKKVNLSPATCHRRTQRLFDQNIVSSVRAEVNPCSVDRNTMVLVGVVLERSTPESFFEFEKAIIKFSFVLDCHCVAGDYDYMLKIRARNISDFNRLHREQLLTLPGVRQLSSFFVLKEVLDNEPLHF